MRFVRRTLFGVGPALALSTLSLNAQPASAPPVIVKAIHYAIVLEKSGLATETVHVELQPTNAAAAQEVTQQPIPYSESMADLDVLDARIDKPDGRTIPVPSSAIYAQPAPGSSQEPMFNDLRQKVIVFPNVEAGDTLSYTARFRDKQPYMPNAFSTEHMFSRLIAYRDIDFTLTAPRDFPLQTETHDMQVEKTETESTVTWHWHASNPVPLNEEPSALSAKGTAPRLLVSSFADYDAFAHAFAPLVTAKAQVTPAIQAQAEAITANISGRRAQAQAIYEWVSQHIHYVAIEIGRGAIVPHDAATVLANGYGDCKDHVVLFSALLKARGIDSALVLIDTGDTYALPQTAVIGAFNHAITWIPEFSMFADTTASVAPFGMLPFAEYGKEVILALPSGNAKRTIPVLPPGEASVSIRTTARIEPDGHLTGQTTTSASGPFSIALRSMGVFIQTLGPERAATLAFQNMHVAGTGSFVVPPPYSLSPEYQLTGSFSIGPIEGLAEGRRFVPESLLALSNQPGDFLMGSLGDEKSNETDPTPCFSGHQDQDIVITAPAGRNFLPPPNDSAVRTANLEFSTHWSVSGDTLKLHRSFTSHVDTALCAGQVRKDTVAAFAQIRREYLQGAAVAPQLTAQQSLVLSGVRSALNEVRQGNDAAALRRLTEIIDAAEKQPDDGTATLAYITRGALNFKMGQFDDAIADYGAAVRHNPAVAPLYTELAKGLVQVREFARAERVLSSAIANDPTSAGLYDTRGIVRDYQGRHGEAQDDLTRAIVLGGTSQAVAKYYFDRGMSYWSARDNTAALHDFSAALDRDPTSARTFAARGRMELEDGRYDEARADLTRAADLDPKNVHDGLRLYIATARSGGDAKAELARRSPAYSATGWPAAIVKVYLGETAPDALVMPSRAEPWERQRDLCEAKFFLGELALLRGERDQALGLFRAAVATNTTEFVEYYAAGLELDRLAAVH
jgi:lipoprotein NlpI